jgi:putative Holliday junction resolvase
MLKNAGQSMRASPITREPRVIVALDLGRRRIGTAATDSLGIAIYPLRAIERRSEEEDLETLRALILDCDAGHVVAGLPLNMDGSEGSAARWARRFAARLAQALDVPVEMHDERLTTFEARDRLKLSGGTRWRRRARIDCLAAVIILESWLASRAQADS